MCLLPVWDDNPLNRGLHLKSSLEKSLGVGTKNEVVKAERYCINSEITNWIIPQGFKKTIQTILPHFLASDRHT